MSSTPPAVPVTPADVAATMSLVRPHVRRTPVMEVEGALAGVDAPVLLKLELLQHGGSFKPRGAFARVLRAPLLPAAGLVAASGGNHGIAVAHVAAALGVRAEVFVPATSPAAKVQRIARLGATVVQGGAVYDDAQAASDVRARATGALVVHPYAHEHTVAGAGTVAMELEEQAGLPHTVLVACGGGGLLAGVAAWFAGRARVVSVEPERIPAMAAALAAGHPVPVDVSGVAADSLGARQVGEVPFAVARAHVQEAVLVPDAAIRAAQRRLWAGLQLVVEPGGAAAFAALQCGAYVPEPGERVAVVVCGANCDPATVLPEPEPEPEPEPGTRTRTRTSTRTRT